MSNATSNSNLNAYFDGQTVLHIEQRARALQAESLAKFFGSIANAARRFVNRVRADMNQRRVVAELSQLDDRLLADVGLSRANLPEGLKQIGRQETAYHGPAITGDTLVSSRVSPNTPANTDIVEDRRVA